MNNCQDHEPYRLLQQRFDRVLRGFHSMESYFQAKIVVLEKIIEGHKQTNASLQHRPKSEKLSEPEPELVPGPDPGPAPRPKQTPLSQADRSKNQDTVELVEISETENHHQSRHLIRCPPPPHLSPEAPQFSPVTASSIAPSDSASNVQYYFQPRNPDHSNLVPTNNPNPNHACIQLSQKNPILNATHQVENPSVNDGEIVIEIENEIENILTMTTSTIMSTLSATSQAAWTQLLPDTINYNRVRGKPQSPFAIVRLAFIPPRLKQKLDNLNTSCHRRPHQWKYVVAAIQQQLKTPTCKRTLFRYECLQRKQEKINGTVEKFVFVSRHVKSTFLCEEIDVVYFLPAPYHTHRGRLLFEHDFTNYDFY